jgi:hypothetical protein
MADAHSWQSSVGKALAFLLAQLPYPVAERSIATGGQRVTFQETHEEEPQAILYFAGDEQVSKGMGAWLKELGADIINLSKVEITNEYDYQDVAGEMVTILTGKVTVVLRFKDGGYRRRTFKRGDTQ